MRARNYSPRSTFHTEAQILESLSATRKLTRYPEQKQLDVRFCFA
jgi:hypothetical protein